MLGACPVLELELGLGKYGTCKLNIRMNSNQESYAARWFAVRRAEQTEEKSLFMERETKIESERQGGCPQHSSFSVLFYSSLFEDNLRGFLFLENK